MNYRLAGPDDIPQLSQLGLNAYGQLKGLLSEEHWEVIRASIANQKTFSDLLNISTCFVCEARGTLIGMAFFIPSGNPTPVFQADWCYLRLVGVAPGHGGLGIGRKLTRMCLDTGRTNGEKTIALHTSDFMDAARHIYESLGFRPFRDLPARFGKKYWVYTMDL